MHYRKDAAQERLLHVTQHLAARTHSCLAICVKTIIRWALRHKRVMEWGMRASSTARCLIEDQKYNISWRFGATQHPTNTKAATTKERYIRAVERKDNSRWAMGCWKVVRLPWQDPIRRIESIYYHRAIYVYSMSPKIFCEDWNLFMIFWFVEEKKKCKLKRNPHTYISCIKGLVPKEKLEVSVCGRVAWAAASKGTLPC